MMNVMEAAVNRTSSTHAELSHWIAGFTEIKSTPTRSDKINGIIRLAVPPTNLPKRIFVLDMELDITNLNVPLCRSPAMAS